MESPHYRIVIPAYNAGATIGVLLERLRSVVPREMIIVVDDGSTDATAAVARSAGVAVVSHPANRGKGAALSTGFEVALAVPGLDCVLSLDADLQHAPEEIPSLLEARRSTGAHIVIGARERRSSPMPFARRISNALTSFLVSARTGTTIPDSQSGFRLIGREVLEHVHVRSSGYEAETELLLKAVRSGFRVASVPVPAIYGGEKSHMTHWHTTVRFVQVLFEDA